MLSGIDAGTGASPASAANCSVAPQRICLPLLLRQRLERTAGQGDPHDHRRGDKKQLPHWVWGFVWLPTDGTGFLGNRIVERLVGVGEIVRVAARRPERLRSGLVPAGYGRAVPIVADIREEKSVAAAVAGMEGMVNAVSAYVENGNVTYAAIHVQDARNVARACERQKVSRLIHISGIGADPALPSAYIRVRGQGEQEIQRAFAQATILRPSVMFARDDAFLNALVALARFSPVIPLTGGRRDEAGPAGFASNGF